MTITVRDPDGGTHDFPDGTPDSAINAEMQKRWAARGVPKPEPLAGPGMMPPGTVPARSMQSQPGAPDPAMVPLSEDAQRAQRMMGFYGLKGNRAGATAAHNLLTTDPTYIARKRQAEKMGEDAGTLYTKQAAATRVYEAINELEQKARAWYEHNPDAFNAGTGPWNQSQTLQKATGWLNRGGQSFNNLMHHDIEKLVALYREMPSAGKGTGSDAQDANFKDAMGKWMESPDPKSAFAVLQSAKGLIRSKGGLSHDFDLPRQPLDPRDVASINTYAKRPIGPDSPYVRPDYFDENGRLNINVRPQAGAHPPAQRAAPDAPQPEREARSAPAGSRENPIPVDDPAAARLYRPGTWVMTPRGLGQVP